MLYPGPNVYPHVIFLFTKIAHAQSFHTHARSLAEPRLLTSKFVKNVLQTTAAEAVANACRQGYKDIMSLRKGNNDLFLLFLERESQSSRCLMHCLGAVSNTTIHEAVSVDFLPTIHVYIYCTCIYSKGTCEERAPMTKFKRV